MKRTVWLMWAVSMMIGMRAGWTQAEVILGGKPIAGLAGNGGAEITADKFEVEQKTGWIIATGNAKIKTEDHEMRADSVRLHRERGDVEARGNVILRQTGFGTWAGDSIEYNYKTGKGLMGLGDLKMGDFRILTQSSTRNEKGSYDAKYMQVTTCTNAQDSWHWSISGNGHYQENEYVSIKHAVPRLFGIPFAYLPYFYREINPNYGFRFIPGYTSRWGAYLLGGYIFNIYDSPKQDGVILDGRTHVDYRTRRGMAVGQDFTWDLKELGYGKLETYYAWDLDPPDNSQNNNWVSDVNEQRYRFRLRHTTDITPRDQFLLRGTYVSDSQMSSDYFIKDTRSESVPVNIASLSHREDVWATGVQVSGPLNNFYGGVSRLPEGWLNIMPQPFLVPGLNYESQTRAGYLDRTAEKYSRATDPRFMYNPGQWADYNLARVDTAHRVTYPMRFGDVFSVVPRAGYHGTYYGESEHKDNVARHTGELGIEASMRATAELGNGYRHVVEPYLDYSYQPSYFDSSNGKPYMFDRVDRSFGWLDQFGMDGTWLPYDWHGIRPGVRNLLQTQDENNRARTLLEWDAYAAIQFDSEGPVNETGLRMLGSKATYKPVKDLDIRAMVEWDTEAQTVAYTDLSAFYKLSQNFRLGGGYLGRDHALYDYGISPVSEWKRVTDNLLYGGFTHDINKTWSWSSYVRFDALYNELDEVGGYVQYSLDCLVFQVRTAYVNRFDRIDNTSDRSSDFRVAFLMWLKVENRKTRDEWLTW